MNLLGQKYIIDLKYSNFIIVKYNNVYFKNKREKM